MIALGFFFTVAVLCALYIVACEFTIPKEERLWYNEKKDTNIKKIT